MAEQVKHYGTEADDYLCNDDNVSFGESYSWVERGEHKNNQPILYDGNIVGLLHEYQPWNILQPSEHSFMFCVDYDEIEHPNFLEEEENWIKFAKLQDFVDFIKANPQLLNKYYKYTIK